jgi:protein-S-isoprenylcysteine O-methyltransferase Ste14
METAPLLSRIRPSLSPELQKGGKAFDLLAAAPLILLYSLSASGLLHFVHEKLQELDLARPDFTLSLTILAKLAGLLLMTLFVAILFLRRPPVSSARGILPRVAALGGTYTGVSLLLLPAHEMSALTSSVSILLILSGTLFAVYSVLYLGRSFSIMAEARQLVTSGPYAHIRHPLYAGEGLAVVGLMLQYLSPLALLLFAILVGWQVYRMNCEEEVLEGAFPAYAAYKARTARLIPGVY